MKAFAHAPIKPMVLKKKIVSSFETFDPEESSSETFEPDRADEPDESIVETSEPDASTFASYSEAEVGSNEEEPPLQVVAAVQEQSPVGAA